MSPTEPRRFAAPCLSSGALVLALLCACSFYAQGLGEDGSATRTSPSSSSTSGTGETVSTGSSGMTTMSSESSTSSTTEPACESPMSFYKDADKDGFGDPESAIEACEMPDGYVTEGGDCDDASDAVHPGADEICDSQDNDCDDATDEYSATNTDACDGCKMEVRQDGEGDVLYFCGGPASWESARERCERRGAQLVSISDMVDFAAIWAVLKPLGQEHWIGASDLEDEGTYVWLDGTNLGVSDSNWALGQPKDDAPDLDCVILNGSKLYAMRPCDVDAGLPWVCEGPSS